MKQKKNCTYALLCMTLVVGFAAPAFAGFSFTPKQDNVAPIVQDDEVPAAALEESIIPPVSQPEMVPELVSGENVVPPASVKQQALPVFASKDDFKGEVVEGFGSGIPLVIAVRQIVPPKYGFVFGDGLDLGMKVDWQGGKPWNEVLDNLGSVYNFSVRISNDIVKLVPSNGKIVVPIALSEEERAVLAPIPMDDAMPVTITPPVVIETPMIEPIKDETPVVQENSTSKPEISWNEPASVPVISADGTVTELVTQDEPSMPEPITKKKILVLEEKTTAPIEKVAEDMAPPAMPEPQDISAPELVDSVQKETQNVDLASIQPFPVGQTPESVWTAEKGDTLRSVMKKWADTEGISLVWNSEYDYPIQADVTVVGTFESAVRNLLDGFSMASPKPAAKLYKNKPAGMPVLVVETIQISK